MNKLISTAALVAISTLGLVACGEANLKFRNGEYAPRPTTTIAENGFKVLASFDSTDSPTGEASPTLEKWSNGRVVVTCPRGFHFEVTVIDPIYKGPAASATCEPNAPPAE